MKELWGRRQLLINKWEGLKINGKVLLQKRLFYANFLY